MRDACSQAGERSSCGGARISDNDERRRMTPRALKQQLYLRFSSPANKEQQCNESHASVSVQCLTFQLDGVAVRLCVLLTSERTVGSEPNETRDARSLRGHTCLHHCLRRIVSGVATHEEIGHSEGDGSTEGA